MAVDEATVRGLNYLRVVARLKPDVTLRQAQAEMDAIARRMARQYPEWNSGVGVRVVALAKWIVGDVERPLYVLFAAVVSDAPGEKFYLGSRRRSSPPANIDE
jgi:putative ABC transport system permease protein